MRRSELIDRTSGEALEVSKRVVSSLAVEVHYQMAGRERDRGLGVSPPAPPFDDLLRVPRRTLEAAIDERRLLLPQGKIGQPSET